MSQNIACSLDDSAIFFYSSGPIIIGPVVGMAHGLTMCQFVAVAHGLIVIVVAACGIL